MINLILILQSYEDFLTQWHNVHNVRPLTHVVTFQVNITVLPYKLPSLPAQEIRKAVQHNQTDAEIQDSN